MDAERQAGVGVAEVLGEGLDVLARVQEDRGVEVAQGVHAVLAGLGERSTAWGPG
ncbi:hypothetical protein ACWGH4_04850 [Streptomyces sp. NPDC054847]